MKHDCLFNIRISVLTGGIEVHKLSVQIVKVQFYLSTSREFSFAVLACVGISLGIELSCDSIPINGDEVSNHVPK
jgi:hypothetical protein